MKKVEVEVLTWLFWKPKEGTEPSLGNLKLHSEA